MQNPSQKQKIKDTKHKKQAFFSHCDRTLWKIGYTKYPYSFNQYTILEIILHDI